MNYILLILGLLLLIVGANYLIKGSSSLAAKLKIPPLVIGLTVVSIGTSLPELIFNVFSAAGGKTEMALGNIVGSNITNILLILGVSAIVYPLTLSASCIKRDIPFCLSTALTLFFLSNLALIAGIETNTLNIFSAFVLFILLGFYIYLLYKIEKNWEVVEELEEKKLPNHHILFYILIGIIGLFIGGELTVNSAVNIAKNFGMSEFLISSTIIALGTSLPELFTSVGAALKKNGELAVGNVLGSNIFNIILVLSSTIAVSPVIIPNNINTNLIFMIFASILVLLFIYIKPKYTISRKEGFTLLFVYILYIFTSIYRG